MEIKFIGVGGAFDSAYGNSSAIITVNGVKILVDCGHTVFPTLNINGLVSAPDYVLITHLHDDHVGGLSSLLYYRYFSSGGQKTKILTPSPLFKDLLANFLSFAMLTPERFVEFIPIESINGVQAIDTYGLHLPEMPGFAYVFSDEADTFVYSGDIGDCNALFEKIEKKRIIPTKVFHELTFQEGIPPHTYYKDLFAYLNFYRIYGYHCDPQKNPMDNVVPLVYFCKEYLLFP